MARLEPTTLLLVRHGETEDNAAGRLSGWRDVPLTATGRLQARRLAAYLASQFTIDAIYASPLMRAMTTARCVGRRSGLEPIPLDGLRERALGRLEGRRHPDGQNRGFAALVRREGGESTATFRARVLCAMEQIVASHRGKTVAVVSHGGPLAVYLATALQGNAARWWEFKMDNAALTVISVGRAGATLHRFNSGVASRAAGPQRRRPGMRGRH